MVDNQGKKSRKLSLRQDLIESTVLNFGLDGHQGKPAGLAQAIGRAGSLCLFCCLLVFFFFLIFLTMVGTSYTSSIVELQLGYPEVTLSSSFVSRLTPLHLHLKIENISIFVNTLALPRRPVAAHPPPSAFATLVESNMTQTGFTGISLVIL